MRALGRLAAATLTLVVLLLANAASECAGQRARGAYRRASARSDAPPDEFVDVTFSNAEEDLLKAKQRDTADAIAGLLPGKTPNQVARRCIELGLKCGGAFASPPARSSEQWRAIPRRGRA